MLKRQTRLQRGDLFPLGVCSLLQTTMVPKPDDEYVSMKSSDWNIHVLDAVVDGDDPTTPGTGSLCLDELLTV